MADRQNIVNVLSGNVVACRKPGQAEYPAGMPGRGVEGRGWLLERRRGRAVAGGRRR
jgi:hypothetical protein